MKKNPIPFAEIRFPDPARSRSELEARSSKHFRAIRAERAGFDKPMNADGTVNEELWQELLWNGHIPRPALRRIDRRSACIAAREEERSGLGHLKSEDRKRLEALREGVSVVPVPSEHRIDELAAELHDRFPWMGAATELVWQALRRSIRIGDAGFRLPPLLLDGPPGIGKSTWTLQHGFTEVDLRWDHADIGAISVHLDGRWHEVSAVHGNAADGHSFDGVSAAEWRAATNALKTRDQKRKLWDESVVFAALDEIQALNTRKQLAAGIVNTNWTAETFAAREAMYDGFKVGSTPKKVRQADDGFGRSIEPRAPLDQVPDAPAAADAPLTRKPKRGGKAPTMAFKE